MAAELQRLEGKAGGVIEDLAGATTTESGEGSKWAKVRSQHRNLKLNMAKSRLKHMDLYQKLEPDVQVALLDAVNYRGIMPRGTVIFKQGDVPGKDDPGDCYIIMSGEVSVWVALSEERAVPEDDDRRRRTAPSSPTNGAGMGTLPDAGSGSPKSPSRGHAVLGVSNRKESDEVCTSTGDQHWGSQVAAIGPGSLLGSHALLRGEPRNATCVASLDCEMLSIRSFDFDRVLKPVFANKKDEKEVFLLARVPGLAHMEHFKPETMVPNFLQGYYNKRHIFWNQGLSIESPELYVVLKGVVEVRHQRVTGEPERVISTLLPGAVFGTYSGQPEPFKVCVGARASCDVYQARGEGYRRLPASVRQAIQEHISQANDLHLERTWPAEDGGYGNKEWWAESEGIQHLFGSKAKTRSASLAERHNKQPVTVTGRHQLREAAKQLAANPTKTPKAATFQGSWKNWTHHGRAHIQSLIFEDMAPLAMEGRLPVYKDLSGWLKPCPSAAPPSRRPDSATTRSASAGMLPEQRRPGSCASSSTERSGSRGRQPQARVGPNLKNGDAALSL